jgi:hypothetical protein
MRPWESVPANRRREGEAGGERGRLGWAVGRGNRRESSAVGTEGAFDFARAGTTSADDGLRTAEAQPLERTSGPICPARAAIQVGMRAWVGGAAGAPREGEDFAGPL